MDPHTVGRGREQLLAGELEGSGPQVGSGEGTCGKKTPEVIARIEKLLEYETGGDPMTRLKWTRKTLGKIAQSLVGLEYR